MQQAKKKENEAQDKLDVQEDLAHGQIVIIAFRWLIIAAALVVTLWALADPAADVTRQALITFLLLVYAAVNFVLLSRYLRRSRSLAGLAYFMSLVDLVLITVVIAIQEDMFASHVYVYYYPALMVLAVAFPTGLTSVYAVGAIVVYGLMVWLGAGAEGQQILPRLLVMAAVAFCGWLYRRIEHDRRTGKARVITLVGGGPDPSSLATEHNRMYEETSAGR